MTVSLLLLLFKSSFCGCSFMQSLCYELSIILHFWFFILIKMNFMNGILFITIVITFLTPFLVTWDAILNIFFSMSRLSLYYIRREMFVSLDLCLERQQGISPYICSILLGLEKKAKIWLFDTKSVKREVREKDVGQTSNGPFSLQGVSFSWSETDTEREGGILSFKFRLQQSDKWSSIKGRRTKIEGENKGCSLHQVIQIESCLLFVSHSVNPFRI